MFFLATADADGAPQCSYKGGEPGFVRVVDARTIAFPVYDGNGMFLSIGNMGVNPHVGILFIDFETGTRLRFNGVAGIDQADPLVESYPGAQFVVRVLGDAVFANCRRYVHHYELVERSPFVPSAGPRFPSRTGSRTRGSRAPSRRTTPRSTPAVPWHPPSRCSEPASDQQRPATPACLVDDRVASAAARSVSGAEPRSSAGRQAEEVPGLGRTGHAVTGGEGQLGRTGHELGVGR